MKSNILFLALLVLLIFIPLFPKFPLSSVSGTYVAIRLEDILIAVILGFWFFSNLRNLKKIILQSITQVILLFWFIGFVSLISGIFVTHSVSPHLGLLHLLRRIEFMSLFFVAATVVKNRIQLKTILLTSLVTTLLIVIYGIGQIYFGFPVISTTNREYSKGLILTLSPGARPNATFAGHYDLAGYLSMAMVFIGVYFFYYKKIWEKGILVFAGFASGALLGLTAARASFAAAFFGLAFSFFLLKKKIFILLLIIASIGVIAAVPQLRHRLVATVTVNLIGGGGPKYLPSPGAENQFTPLAPGFVATDEGKIVESTKSATDTPKIAADIAPGEPTNSTELGVYRSFNIRTDVEWPRAMRAFYKNPILGTGYSSLTIATDNDFLRALGETGILGVISLVLVFFVLIKRFWKNLKNEDLFIRYFIIANLCCILVILVTGTFIDILEASKIAAIFWMLMGIGWGVLRKEDEV